MQYDLSHIFLLFPIPLSLSCLHSPYNSSLRICCLCWVRGRVTSSWWQLRWLWLKAALWHKYCRCIICLYSVWYIGANWNNFKYLHCVQQLPASFLSCMWFSCRKLISWTDSGNYANFHVGLLQWTKHYMALTGICMVYVTLTRLVRDFKHSGKSAMQSLKQGGWIEKAEWNREE